MDQLPKAGERYRCTQCPHVILVEAAPTTEDSTTAAAAERVEYVCCDLDMVKLEGSVPFTQVINNGGVARVVTFDGAGQAGAKDLPLFGSPVETLRPAPTRPVLGDDPYAEIKNNPPTVPPNRFGEHLLPGGDDQ